MPLTFWSQCCLRETCFCARFGSPQSHELLEKHARPSLALLVHLLVRLPLASPCLSSVGALLVSLALQVQLRSGSFAGSVALCNPFGRSACCFQIGNLSLSVVAMRSVGRRAPRAAELLFAPPPAAVALAAVVCSQSPLDFGLVAAADTWRWETAENWTALSIGSVDHFPGLELTWERTSG